MSNTIEGIWHSRYEYGKGPDNEPQTSEHEIEFTRQDDTWIGSSAPQGDGSEVTLTLKQNGDEFQGEWRERTSPTGVYGGREFGGAVLLILQVQDTELSGMWLGRSSSTNQVKPGVWTLKRERE